MLDAAATMPEALIADIAALPVATRDRLVRKVNILGEVMRRAAIRFTDEPTAEHGAAIELLSRDYDALLTRAGLDPTKYRPEPTEGQSAAIEAFAAAVDAGRPDGPEAARLRSMLGR